MSMAMGNSGTADDRRRYVDAGEAKAVFNAIVLAPDGTAQMFASDVFNQLKCNVVYANTTEKAAKRTAAGEFDIYILPLIVNEQSTLPLIASLLKQSDTRSIVVISESGQINDAAEAMRIGAVDCVFIPFTRERLLKTISNVLRKKNRDETLVETGAQSRQNVNTAAQGASKTFDPVEHVRHGMILSDLSMQPILRTLDTVASSAAPVFIQGETGSGKEILARAIHAESGRAKGQFVVVDCARLKHETLASEVFGHRKDAFPNASADKIGAAQAADGGTLFLDEIAHTDLRVQKQLMRFLETGEIFPLGGTNPIKIDARIICSTTSDPLAEIKAGRLREDLYYRLHVVPITLLALRNRRDDIVAIATSKLIHISEQEGRRFRGFTQPAIDGLLDHAWPGNVRQLINVIWNIVLHHDGDLVTADMLPHDLLAGSSADDTGTPGTFASLFPTFVGRTLDEIEQIVVEETIRSTGGSIPKAAHVLGVSPSTIYRKRESWSRKSRKP